MTTTLRELLTLSVGFLVAACGQIKVQFGTVNEPGARTRPRFDVVLPSESLVTPFRLRLMDRFYVFDTLKTHFAVDGDSSLEARNFLSALESSVLGNIHALGGACDPLGVRPPNSAFSAEGLAPPSVPIPSELSFGVSCGSEPSRSQLPAIAVGGPIRTASLSNSCQLVASNNYSLLTFIRRTWRGSDPQPVSLGNLARAPSNEELLEIHRRFFGSRPLGSHNILESLRTLADQSFERVDPLASWQMPILAVCESEDWTVP
jgi:hypothetical protein